MEPINEPALRSLTRKLLRVGSLPIRDFITEELKLHPIQGAFIESVESAPPHEAELVARLVSSFKTAREVQRNAPAAYQAGADWKKLLDHEWAKCYEALDRNDVQYIAAFLRNFFRNEGLSGFWGGASMFQTFASNPTRLSRANLMRQQYEIWRDELPDADIRELHAPEIGNPWGYVIDDTLIYEPAFEYHYQANYFAELLSSTARPVIIEIGGGFGGLAYQIVKRIPNALYIGLDLPENVLVQTYYLSCAFPERKTVTFDGDFNSRELSEAQTALLPNFVLPQLTLKADLIINVRSLSEMSAEAIAEYFKQIDRLGRLFFFHENLYRPRGDGWHGIPISNFPKLQNFSPISSSVSRWPRYQANSVYPCRENLFLRKEL